jgi:hypothetical protein
MDTLNWQKQTNGKPLFPELLWTKPQNSRHAGKLLIIGGSQQNFSAVAETYSQATKAGIGSARVVLPSSLQKVVGGFFPEALFAPTTPSGSFSSPSVSEFLVEAGWADAVVLAGNLGNNSETAIAIETFIDKFEGPLIIGGDTIELLTASSKALLVRPMTTLVLKFPQLQHFLTATSYKTAITSKLDLLQIITILNDFSRQYSINIVTEYALNISIVLGGKVSTTKISKPPLNFVALMAFSAVWLLQNPNKPFEALSTAAAALLETSD